MNKWKVVALTKSKAAIGVIKEIDNKGNIIKQVTELLGLDIAHQIVNEHNELRLFKLETWQQDKFCIVCNKTVPINIKIKSQTLLIKDKTIIFDADEAHCIICGNYIYVKELHDAMLKLGNLIAKGE